MFTQTEVESTTIDETCPRLWMSLCGLCIKRFVCHISPFHHPKTPSLKSFWRKLPVPCVSRRVWLENVEEIQHNFVQGKDNFEHHPRLINVWLFLLFAPSVLEENWNHVNFWRKEGFWVKDSCSGLPCNCESVLTWWHRHCLSVSHAACWGGWSEVNEEAVKWPNANTTGQDLVGKSFSNHAKVRSKRTRMRAMISLMYLSGVIIVAITIGSSYWVMICSSGNWNRMNEKWVSVTLRK